mmetsp:Transcript_1918/g.5286  ORF Transcript_1918/g.5286 Transcript_1918/m.5286 type:complete len:109 (+) Transcript_1918:316-642(+)
MRVEPGAFDRLNAHTGALIVTCVWGEREGPLSSLSLCVFCVSVAREWRSECCSAAVWLIRGACFRGQQAHPVYQWYALYVYLYLSFVPYVSNAIVVPMRCDEIRCGVV